MYLLFVDESGSPPPPGKTNTKYFVIGGIVIPEHTWAKVRNDLERIKASWHIAGEIKWRHFSPHNTDSTNTMKHLTFEERIEVRKSLLDVINKYNSVKIITAVIDVQAAYREPYCTTPANLYWYAYKQVTERFQYLLQDMGREVGEGINGIIVCDHRGPKDDEQLRNLHQKLLSSVDENISKYENLIEGLFLAPSHLSVGIQFADIVAGSVFRKYEQGDSTCFDQIEPSFRKSKNGKIEGYGLILWPKSR